MARMYSTKYSKSWGAGLALILSSLVGCKMAAGTSASTTPGDTVVTEGSSGAGAGESTCPTPEDHCLLAGELLVTEAPFESGYVTAYPATAAGAANAAGEAPYTKLSDGGTITTRHAFATHRATAEELVAGVLVAAPDLTGEGGVYRAPKTREEATTDWFIGRIVSVDPADQGHVILSGGYRVATDAMRRIAADASASIATPGQEDAWFVKPEHWFVSDQALPDTGYAAAHLALAVEPPSDATRGEGRFLVTSTGAETWTRHAWRSRAAEAKELKKGMAVIVFDATGDAGVYRAPTSRVEAVTGAWFIGKITDTAEAFKGVVTVAGDYRASVEGLRVLVK